MAGTHRVFLANVTRAVAREGSPLTYFRGKFGRFEVEQDRVVYGELRSRILNRSFSLEDSLDVGHAGQGAGVLPATIYHAVTKLVADGLLARDPERGYVVKPVTPETSEQAFDARCAMELGVAATTVGQVPAGPGRRAARADGGDRAAGRRRAASSTSRPTPGTTRRSTTRSSSWRTTRP